MIERARERRAWEAQLPPADDAYRAVERARAMQEQEAREWRYREDQIQKIQVGVCVCHACVGCVVE